MSNPARDLLGLLTAWHVPKSDSILNVRAASGGTQPSLTNLEMWHEIQRGLRIVAAYEAAVDTLEANGRNVDHYRRILPEVYGAIFAPEANWSAGSQGHVGNVSASTITALELAGDAMEGLVVNVELTSDRIAQIIDALNGAHDLLDELPESLERHHLQWQIEQAIMFAQSVDRFGTTVAAASAAEVLRDIVEFTKREDVGEAERGRLRQFAYDVWVNMVGSAAGTLALNAASGPGAELVRAILP